MKLKVKTIFWVNWIEMFVESFSSLVNMDWFSTNMNENNWIVEYLSSHLGVGALYLFLTLDWSDSIWSDPSIASDPSSKQSKSMTPAAVLMSPSKLPSIVSSWSSCNKRSLWSCSWTIFLIKLGFVNLEFWIFKIFLGFWKPISLSNVSELSSSNKFTFYLFF